MIIADTGFWVALADKKDRFHFKANELIKHTSERLISPTAVITETSHIILKRKGITTLLQFIAMYQMNAFDIFEIPASDKTRIFELMQQYRDLPMDFADASLVILAEHLGHGRILSTDKRDFHTYRWKNHQPFENLLLM